MKELSIEEKAKAYDIALDKIKRLLGTGSSCSREELEYIFPELKESEDEQTRKEILSFCQDRKAKYFNDPKYVNIDKWIAWLEKQGEQKSTEWSGTDIMYLENLIAMVDAKEYPEYIKWLISIRDRVQPQPKQEWSEEDEKIKESIITGLEMLKDGASDKSLITLYNKKIDWLKSLKGRVGCEANCTTTKECSEEDEQLINEVAECLRKYARKVQGGNSKVYVLSLADRIESLRPQNKWKPSDEQIMALRWVLNHISYDSHKEEISGLLEQLKKLREE